jgi:hypothetical protein
MDKEYLFVLFEVATIILLVIAFVYLLALSILVKEYAFIVEKPFTFFIELVFMTVLPGIPLLFFAFTRGLDIGKAVILASTFSAKVGAFHVIFQLSGIYKYTLGI